MHVCLLQKGILHRRASKLRKQTILTWFNRSIMAISWYVVRWVHFGGWLYLKINKPTFAVAGMILLLIICVTVISNFLPKYEEQFIELGVLGRNRTATGYYPNDNPSLSSGSQINWYIYLHNHMAGSQAVSVKVKLLNSTMQQPNDTAHTSSPFPSIAELPITLPVNGTQLVPFTWSISETDIQDNSIVIKSLTVNGQTVYINIPTTYDTSFCIVFELWVYDQSTQRYQFGWDAGKGISSASVSMWFNVNSP